MELFFRHVVVVALFAGLFEVGVSLATVVNREGSGAILSRGLWQPLLVEAATDPYPWSWGREPLLLPALGDNTTATKGRAEAESSWGQRLATEFAGVLIAAGDDLNRDKMASTFSAVASRVRQRVAGQVAVAAEQWLQRFGQASISLESSPGRGSLLGIDISFPLFQSVNHSLLVEVGARSRPQAGNYLVDGGLIYRYGRSGGQVVGINAFIDQDMTGAYLLTAPGVRPSAWQTLALQQVKKGPNQRGSVGLEWTTPWWGITANIYQPLSNWYSNPPISGFDFSKDPTVFGPQQRPSRGFDINLEARMVYTPLTIKASYSRWLNDHVDVSQQQKEVLSSPQSTRLAVSWQPLSLLKFSASHAFSSGKRYENRFQVELRVGRDLFRITSPSVLSRAARNRLVNRDPNMVFAYQYQRVPTLKAGPDIHKTFDDDQLSFTQTATGGNGSQVTYTSSDENVAKVDPNSGKVTLIGSGEATITATQAERKDQDVPGQRDSYQVTVEKGVGKRLRFGEVACRYGDDTYAPLATGADNSTVTHISDNPAVAKVTDDGKVQIVGRGDAIITAYATSDCYQDQSDSYLLKVGKGIGNNLYFKDSTIDKTFDDGTPPNFQFTVIPEGGNDGTITYTSSVRIYLRLMRVLGA